MECGLLETDVTMGIGEVDIELGPRLLGNRVYPQRVTHFRIQAHVEYFGVSFCNNLMSGVRRIYVVHSFDGCFDMLKNFLGGKCRVEGLDHAGVVVGYIGQCDDTVVVVKASTKDAEGAAVVARETVV